MIQEIQGIKCSYRDPEQGEDIFYSNLPKDEQFFRRQEHPFTDDELVAIASKEHSYSDLQKKWVDREKERMNQGRGVYMSINGKSKYIPGSYYGYVNYWTLENGDKPEYREADRLFFLFMEFCCFISMWILATTRGKGRRKGATSQGTYWEWWICGRNPNKIGGMVSYNNESVSKIFSMMFMRGFKNMLPCFIEDFDSDSDNFIRFVKPVEKKKKGVPIKREGLNSYIDYQPTTLNSYDSGRVSFLLGDEWGKWEKVDVNVYWSKVNPTLTEGDYKVGFAYIPTTVNPKNKGGANFRIFWDAANQFDINPDTGEPYGEFTPSRVVRYFDPATEGYAGCIDKFGDSVIDDPATPIMGNRGIWITEGSKSRILNRRKKLDGDRLMEHRRDYPLDEFDLFAFETGQCEFNELALVEQIKWVKEHPEKCLWRQVRFYEEYNGILKKREVKWADDPKGNWWLFEEPKEPNKFNGTLIEPENTTMFSAGADTYRNIFAIEGSDGVVLIMKKSCIISGEETGLYPVAIFVGRPKLIKAFNYQAYLGCLLYGCKINYEIDAGTWYFENFQEWDAMRLLEWEPARDPVRRERMIKPGTESAQPFQLAKQLEVAKMYVDGTRVDAYNGNVHRITYLPLLQQLLEYNHSERTPYHLCVALMMALLPMLGVPAPPPPPPPSRVLLRTYKVKIPH